MTRFPRRGAAGILTLSTSLPGRPPGQEPDPLKHAEIEDADWEEIDDGKGNSP